MGCHPSSMYSLCPLTITVQNLFLYPSYNFTSPLLSFCNQSSVCGCLEGNSKMLLSRRSDNKQQASIVIDMCASLDIDITCAAIRWKPNKINILWIDTDQLIDNSSKTVLSKSPICHLSTHCCNREKQAKQFVIGRLPYVWQLTPLHNIIHSFIHSLASHDRSIDPNILIFR